MKIGIFSPSYYNCMFIVYNLEIGKIEAIISPPREEILFLYNEKNFLLHFTREHVEV